jgi:division/cell wall cluster transcriptional repressor MraZ
MTQWGGQSWSERDVGGQKLPESADNSANLLEFEGLVRGSADEKGRVKCPAVIRRFLEETGETVFFVTTFNKKTVRIYTREDWKRIMERLQTLTTDAAQSVLFVTKVYGSPASMDKQGRILLSANLRKALNVGDEEVHFEKCQQHIEVYSKQAYDEKLAKAEDNLEAKLLEVLGSGIA